MPTTRSPCPSTRATKQTTLLVPMSSAAMMPFLVFATMSPVLTLHLRLNRLCGRGRRRVFRRAALPEIELVWQPKIDHAELTRKELIVAVELRDALQRGHRVLLGQPNLHVVLQDQVPAPLADPHRRAQALGDAGLVSQQQKKITDMLGRAGPAQQQQR